MPQCVKCGKSGVFLLVNSRGVCEQCVLEARSEKRPKCVACRQGADWLSVEGYCKDCLRKRIDERALSAGRKTDRTCEVCGTYFDYVLPSLPGNLLMYHICPDCQATLDGANLFMETNNVIHYRHYRRIIDALLSNELSPDVYVYIAKTINFNDGVRAAEERNARCASGSHEEEGYWEYTTLCVSDKFAGTPNAPAVKSVLNRYGEMGWRLKAAYTNESGKNSLSVKGIGVNSTMDTTVLILERFVKAKSI